LIGEFNIENLLAAISALYFGIEGYSLESIASLVTDVTSVRGRFESLVLPGGTTAIIDYAHTPDALQHVLETTRSLTKGTMITVFGCGGDRDKTKRPEMGRIAAELADRIVITSDNPRTEDPLTIIDQIVAGVPADLRSKVEVIPDRASAIQAALDLAQAGDAVVVAGKGHETYQIIGKEKHHFDDREQVQDWIKSRID
jgi:UDP-N-acetylmuramoyl-L-alanyl-D-glutamate--2,6-diaminopimelate ligase